VFSPGSAQVRNAGPPAHRPVLGESFQVHHRFLPQPARQRHFTFIPFAQARQVLFLPASPSGFPLNSNAHSPMRADLRQLQYLFGGHFQILSVQGFPVFHVTINFAQGIGFLGGAFERIALVLQLPGDQIRHKS
jgi:hypothetical protein